MLELRLPLEGESITDELIRRQTLPENPSQEILDLAKDFQEVYRHLPQIAKELTDYYQVVCRSYDLDPGTVAVFHQNVISAWWISIS